MDENTGKNTAVSPAFLASKAESWKPGESGNPNGRPKGAREGLRARLRRGLRKKGLDAVIAELKAQGVSIEHGDAAEVIAEALIAKAQGGDVPAIKLVSEQTEEPLKTTTKLEGELNSNVTLSFRVIEPKSDKLPDESGA